MHALLEFDIFFQDDMGSDDGGGGGGADQLDLESMNEVPSGMEFGASGALNGGNKANLTVQTLLALKELGIIVGVAFMVGGIFFLMISIEKFMDSVSTTYQKKFGDYKEDDVEDPAALVGTFKRYKN